MTLDPSKQTHVQSHQKKSSSNVLNVIYLKLATETPWWHH